VLRVVSYSVLYCFLQLVETVGITTCVSHILANPAFLAVLHLLVLPTSSTKLH